MKRMFNFFLYMLYKLSPVLFFGGFLFALIGAEDLTVLLISIAVMVIGYCLWSVTEKMLLRRLGNEER